MKDQTTTNNSGCPAGTKPAFPEALDVWRALNAMKGELVKASNKYTELENLFRASHGDAYDGNLDPQLLARLTAIEARFSGSQSNINIKLFVPVDKT